MLMWHRRPRRCVLGFPIPAMTRDYGDVGDLTVAQIDLCYFTFYLLSRLFVRTALSLIWGSPFAGNCGIGRDMAG